MNLVSMSLYGSKAMYHKGAVANARLMSKIYPGWRLRVYAEQGHNYTELREAGAEVVLMPISCDQSGMFWRFLAAWDANVDYVIFRDSDSRINVREAAAVREWGQSGLLAHCMHDHPHHCCLPLSGGMWGIQSGVLPYSLHQEVIKRGGCRQPRIEDMNFLARRVYPLICSSTMRHTSVRGNATWWEGSLPFPSHPPYEGFVGEQFDENDNPIGAYKLGRRKGEVKG